MINDADLAAVVMRANLAPSVHNTQPTRWRRDGDDIVLAADLSLVLSVGDPLGMDAGLSCGAAVEATVLALGDVGLSAEAQDLWPHDDRTTWAGHRMVARLRLQAGKADPLAKQLAARFTWRAAFTADVPRLFGWSRADSLMVMDRSARGWLAQRNDVVSLEIMRGSAFRSELTHWMRFSERHKRYAYDGLGFEAMQMDQKTATSAKWALGSLWRLFDLFGATKGMTAEADATMSAPLILCFHRPVDESPVKTGRAYLRMWLSATSIGLAGWPMAALSDHPDTRAEICERFGIGTDRRLVQVIRFGNAGAAIPPRARRPIEEILL
jgi:hypothetical protein